MSNQKIIPNIFTGSIVQKNKIARNVFHLKVQSADFSNMSCVAGSTVAVFLSNPSHHQNSEVVQYPFWNYEPVFNIADFAIHTFPNSKAADWINEIQEGDWIFFKKPSMELIIDESGEHYFLIGDVSSLAHLYEINRTLAVSKKIYSLVYTENKDEFFPDLDHSFPLQSYVVESLDPENVLALVNLYFPKYLKNTIVYILGNLEMRGRISDFLANNPGFGIQHIYFNNFDDS